jgi:enamine deaminase RidA (YjgF/YER057c/UK114 family)
MRSRASVLCLCAAFCWSALSFAAPQRKKKSKEEKEEITQVLEVPKDPPNAVVADGSRLVFHISPLSAKGLLSQQVRDGLNALLSKNRRLRIVRIRAFVAGSADLRRVPALVSEILTDKRQPLPAVSVVQVGDLGLDGAQVQMESIAVASKPTMPAGLAFISGQPGKASAAAEPLSAILGKIGLSGSAVRRVTCFLNSVEHVNAARTSIGAAFPQAPAVFVQLRRDSMGDFVECEAVAALVKAPSTNPAFVDIQPNGYAQAVLSGPASLAFTGIQLAFGREDTDARLAFDRLNRTLESVNASTKSVIMSSGYPLSQSALDRVRKTRVEFYDKSNPPASTMLLFEGLSSGDAAFGLDVIAVSAKPASGG